MVEGLAPLGLLGGTFNPVHVAHLRLAQEMAQGLGLGGVRFIPAGIPPHRDAPRVDARHRLEMVRLAIAGNALFEADDRELRRQGPSYTFDTLTELRSDVGDRPLCLLMGADAFSALTTWHRWAELFDLAHVVIAHRPGYPIGEMQAALPGPLRKAYLARLGSGPQALRSARAGTILTREITALDVSATAIRAELASGRSPRYLVPDAVLEYIGRNALYKEPDAG
jgi:nicotinate-nucleotide adenylyltransferase